MALNASDERVFIFDKDNKVDVVIGYYFFIGSLLFFIVLNWLVWLVGKPNSVGEAEWRWRNIVISWVHGLIVGSWDIYCLVYYTDMLDDLINHIEYCSYLMVAVSTGYFVYDFLDIAFQGRLVKNYEVTLHHIAVASMFWYNFHCKMCIGYNVLALMAEINSFWLHSRKLLQMTQFRFDHWFYRIVVTINILTFFCCRGWGLSRISYGMYTESNNVPTIYFRCLCFSIFVMNVINPILFWRLLKNDFIRYWFVKRNSKAMVNGNNNVKSNHIKSN